MITNSKIILVLIVLFASFTITFSQTVEENSVETDITAKPIISLADNVGATVKDEVSQIGEELQTRAQSLFTHTPMGWNINTIKTIYDWFKSFPRRVPELIDFTIEQSRVLGFVGSIIILAFLFAIIYSVIISKRLLKKIEVYLLPLKKKLPDDYYPYLISASKILIASLFPFLLLLIFLVIKTAIVFRANWFTLIGKLLWIWTLGALIINFLRESLISEISKISPNYGKTIFRLSRIVLIYTMGSISLFISAKAIGLPPDILAFIKFAISLTIVCSFLIPLNKKNALLSILPELPYKSYEIFIKTLDRYYFTSILLTFFVGLMWCFGFKRFAMIILTRTWAVAGVYILIMLIYHFLRKLLLKWDAKKVGSEEENETKNTLFKSLKSLLTFSMVIALILSTLYLLSLINPFITMLSFTILKVGETHLSVWSFLKVIFIVVAFFYFSNLLRAILDYKFYPFFKIDTGIAYAIDSFLNYFLVGIGFLFALFYIGFDLRFLMVFTGAIGIGIGFGLQNVAANLLSGFMLLFGQRLRKGDWIQVGDTTGVVTQISIRATKVKSRDNIEYIIPNEQFISNMFVNYTLSSPLIRLTVPVGVSYNSDPQHVKELLIKSAEKHPEAIQYKKPDVFFKEYADSSINFDLLVWFDVRKIGERVMRSKLYFTIFQDFKAAGIEIPFPQRDLHFKSGLHKDFQGKETS